MNFHSRISNSLGRGMTGYCFDLSVFAKNTNGIAKGPNIKPIINQNFLLAPLFEAMK